MSPAGVLVRWYERRDRSPDIVARWLGAARAHLPEAVPRRFGDTEPLRGRFDRGGTEALARAHASADSILLLAGTPPVHDATLAAAPARRHGPIAVHSLHAASHPGDDHLLRFALALTHPGTVYVSASADGGGEPYLAPMGDWSGLPPEPPSWCWLGGAYARLAGPHLAAEPVAGGLLYTGGPWVPAPLRARLSEIDPARRHAARMPRGLRRSTLRLIADGLSR
ncbi:hypothetical protein ACFQFC_00775 [Amorphoplanes digitatis]|uniref:Uncharacterized protein n=1 Tax=Actinoplanes digitatis TaxID=1868 RepID=A0A7W7MQT0_9ACTN|nr:hypothetical protein [Actinoplanes digitatis]MBB4762709.1 hypothetical protein [Actinoplanes digitatis]GID91794.1 hypothetical protein Adi01nite_12060 [Actinoplanes digitatis]